MTRKRPVTFCPLVSKVVVVYPGSYDEHELDEMQEVERRWKSGFELFVFVIVLVELKIVDLVGLLLDLGVNVARKEDGQFRRLEFRVVGLCWPT